MVLKLFLSAANFAADWPQLLGPHHNGISDESGLLDSWPESGPPLLWTKAIGTGYGAPSVLGNALVFQHRLANQEIVEALDADTGQRRWTYSYPTDFEDPYGYDNGPRSSPLLIGKYCLAFGAQGKLLCLDLSTGKRIWQHDTGKEWNVPEAFFGVGSSPAYAWGRLFVMIGGQPNSGMAAFEPSTGKVVWESVGKNNWQGAPKYGWPGQPKVRWSEEQKQASYSTPVPAVIHGRRQLLCLMRQGLVSLDPMTGQVLFSYWFRSRVEESVNASSPIVIGDLIFISAAYYHIGSLLLKVKPDCSGVEPVWRSVALEMHWNTPVYLNGYLYGFSGRNEPDARFRCVEFQSGRLMWDLNQRWFHSNEPRPVFGRGSCLLADGKLIVLGEAGLLGMFRPNPNRPEEICRYQVPELRFPSWAAPVLANEKLYLRGEGALVCFDLAKHSQPK